MEAMEVLYHYDGAPQNPHTHTGGFWKPLEALGWDFQATSLLLLDKHNDSDGPFHQSFKTCLASVCPTKLHW